MKEKKLISFKLQNYLSLIPYLGLPIVLFTSFYNISKVKSRLYIGIYFLLTLIPFILFWTVAMLIGKYLITIKDRTVMIILFFVLAFIVMLCTSFACVGIEKSMIERFKKAEAKRIEKNL